MRTKDASLCSAVIQPLVLVPLTSLGRRVTEASGAQASSSAIGAAAPAGAPPAGGRAAAAHDVPEQGALRGPGDADGAEGPGEHEGDRAQGGAGARGEAFKDGRNKAWLNWRRLHAASEH